MSENLKKIVMFDFDGVIVNTYGFCYEIHRSVLGESEEMYRSRFEGNIFDRSKFKTNFSDDFNFFEHYTPKLKNCEPEAGIKEIIASLATAYTLVIVSSTPSDLIKIFLEQNGMQAYFKQILGNDVHTSKVHKIQLVLDKYSVKSPDTIFITDTLGDIKEAEKCNVESIAVTWGYHPVETLKEGNPYSVVNNPEELKRDILAYLS